MSMRRKLLGGAALLMAAFSLTEANATSCAVPPTCAQLGYTMKKADCGDMPVMRCPFAVSDDNQVYCEGTVKVAALPILYGDGQVSKKLLSGTNAPKPIGIVFDETNKLAVALTDVKKDGSAGSEQILWINNATYSIPNLETCGITIDYYSQNEEIISCAVDGRANTDKILACGSGCEGTPAATAVNSYKPMGCSAAFCGQGKWFLPSMRDLSNIYQSKDLFRSTLSVLELLGGRVMVDSTYSSSNGAPYINPAKKETFEGCALNMLSGKPHCTGNSYGYYVRPIVKY